MIRKPTSHLATASLACLALLTAACTQTGNTPDPFATPTAKTLTLPAADAQIIGTHARLEKTASEQHVGWWDNADTFVRWHVKNLAPGTYHVAAIYSLDQDFSGSTIVVSVAGQTFSQQLGATQNWNDYHPLPLGDITIDSPSTDQTITVRVLEKPRQYVMNLQAIQLTPK